MTATPIPRTAAMLVYGDLDKSELREMPPGRTPIATEVVGTEPLDQVRVWQTLARRGRSRAPGVRRVPARRRGQAAKIEAKAATAEFERLQAEELQGLRLGLLHGQMPARDKESVMGEFRAGALDVLVATTVIEVGVDVPNATVMVVEDADRFGLSQLHQLRGAGRVAAPMRRGASWSPSRRRPTARRAWRRSRRRPTASCSPRRTSRSAAPARCSATKQSGMNDLKLGRIPRDEDIVIEARRAAEEILDADPELAGHAQLREEVEDLLGDAVEFLFKS